MKKENFENFGFIYKDTWYKDKVLKFEKGDSYKSGSYMLEYNIDTLILRISKTSSWSDNSGTPLVNTIFEGIITNTEDLKTLFRFLQIYNHNTI